MDGRARGNVRFSNEKKVKIKLTLICFFTNSELQICTFGIKLHFFRDQITNYNVGGGRIRLLFWKSVILETLDVISCQNNGGFKKVKSD